MAKKNRKEMERRRLAKLERNRLRRKGKGRTYGEKKKVDDANFFKYLRDLAHRGFGRLAKSLWRANR